MFPRREFIQKAALGSAGLLLSESILNQLHAFPTHVEKEFDTKWHINADGSIDILSESIQLLGCYPAIDGVPIKPVSIIIKDNAVAYQLPKGKITISLQRQDQTVVYSSYLEGFDKAPHWFLPLAGAKVVGIEKFYYQGIGFGGPSGFADLKSEPYKTPITTEMGSDETWMLESYLIAGLLAESGQTLAISALDHRDYLQKSTLYNKEQRFGLINRHLLAESVYFQSEFSMEEVALKGAKTQLPDLHLQFGNNAWNTFVTLAQRIANEMEVRPAKKPRYHWCSWYIKQKQFSYQDLKKFYEGYNNQNPKPEFQTVQIDDGYEQYYGDWLDFRKECWPDGIKPAFDLIKKNGQEAGIWIGAFMVHKKSKLFAQHPDWVLKKADDSYFSGMDDSCYYLDSSHPQALDYLRKVFRYMKQAGATFFKTDFMDWGLQDSMQCKRYTTGKTSVQYYREALQAIREEIGEDSYWLACISPFPAFLGFADGVRAANDTPEKWGSNNLDNVYSQMQSLHYANNILFQTDPDVMYLNNKLFNYTDAEINTFAYFCGIMGGSVNTSEWLDDADSVKLWRFLAPSGKLEQAVLPYWSENKKFVVAARAYPTFGAWGILVSNISEESRKEIYFLKELVGSTELHVYKWSQYGSAYLGKKTALEQNLASHESALYYVSKSNKPPLANLTIGGKVW